jgi:glycosyltransferase involved in cell wall biosynthesis
MRGQARMKPFHHANRNGSVPRFSVIIPTCNRPQFLAEAVASVMTQEKAEFEIIVVNDGDALPQFSADSRLRHLENARRGAIAARNLGVAAARGEVIAWLDDDDRWLTPDYLMKADDALRLGAGFVHCDGVMVFDDGRPDRAFAQDADVASLAADNTILISGVCYRRSLHDELGGFDPALPFYADWDWYIRVARAGHVFSRVAHPSVVIRIHAANTSGDATFAARQANLNTLSHKHDLGPLSLKTHVDFV